MCWRPIREVCEGGEIGLLFGVGGVRGFDGFYLDVIDPDHITAIESDGITTPDVLRVELGDVNVLDDNVAGTIGDIEAFALDNAFGAGSNQSLIRSNDDGIKSRLVVSNRSQGRVGLVVSAPVVLVDGRLAGRVGAPWGTTGAGDSGTREVEFLVQQDDPRA